MDPTAANETLELLLDLLARELATPSAPGVEIDAGTRFATLGLDSARATAWLARLARRLDRPLAPTLLWDHPTPARLAAFLDGAVAPVPAPGRTRFGESSTAPREPIAIVGMACRLPGATDPEELWRRLTDTRELVDEVPASRWPIDRFYHPDPTHPGTMSTRRGGFLDPIDRFDAAFFGISPHEARAMDPQQRLLLELTWESLEDAGLVPATLQGTPTGVFVGAMAAEYARQVPRQALGPFSATGLDPSVLAGRLAYTFGFEGPALTVNTACSSSLVAVHLARRALDAGEVDLALAAGVHLMILPDGTVAMTKFGGMAPDGRSKAFDAGANGYVRAEGGAVVVLERWSRALAQGHPIYGLIRGSAVNSDGFSNGLTAPNPAAQEAMLHTALADAGLAPGAVDYVETHGPGTLLGDPIEAGALGRVLGRDRSPGKALRIGSHKPHFGHLEAAAGIVGLLKTTLALRHRTLLPSLNFETPNPNIPFESLGLEVQTDVAPWPDTGAPPRAGVSAFGFSGTNAHVVLEGLDERATRAPSRVRPSAPPRCPPLVFVFSGNGSQWLGMGRDLLREPSFQRRIADCDRRLAAILPDTEPVAVATASIARYLATGSESNAPHTPGSDPLDQLALVATQLGLADLLSSWGLAPDAVVGHSVGEVAAACWAGALDLGDTLRVVYHRARLQQCTAGSGALVVADHTADGAVADLRQLGLAEQAEVSAVNGPRSIAVSGEPEALARLVEHWSEVGIECRGTPVSIAFHGAAMEPLVAPLAEALGDLTPTSPRLPMVSAVDGDWVRGGDLGGGFWARHLRQPVRFADAVETMLRDESWHPSPSDGGAPVLVEIAPHPVLGRPLDQLLAGERGHRIPLMRRGEGLHAAAGSTWLGALGRLAELGLPVPDEAFEPPGPERCDPGGPRPGSRAASRGQASDPPWELVPFSAKTPEALDAMIERHRQWLDERLARGRGVRLRRLAHQRATRCSHLEHRRVFVDRDLRGLREQLGAAPGESPAVFGGRRVPGRPSRMVWVFPGQGGQWRGMGRRLHGANPVFRRSLEACDRAVGRHHARGSAFSVVDELLTGTDDAIDTVQPVLFSLQVALAATLEHHGLRPDAVVGHSLGEVAAAHLAGLLRLDDAAKVICRRSRLLGRIRHRGSMLVTECDAASATRRIAGLEDRVALAAFNGPRSTVLSGERETLANLADTLSELGIFQRPVKVEVASHSPLVDPLLDTLRERLADLRPTSPPESARRPLLWSTVWNRAVSEPELDADYWAQNLRRTVRLWPALEALVERGYDTVVEIGPHPVLLPAIEDGLVSLSGVPPSGAGEARKQFHVVDTLRRDEDDREQLARTLATLWAAGADLDWESLQPTAERPLRLPTYPWQRQRFWTEATIADDPEAIASSADSTTTGMGSREPHPWLGPGVESSLHPGTWLWQGILDPDHHPELGDHRLAFEHGFPEPGLRRPVVPAGRWLDLVLSAIRPRVGAEIELGLEAIELREAIEARSGQPLAVQLACEPIAHPTEDPGDEAPVWRFQVATREQDDDPWRIALVGRVVARRAAPTAGPVEAERWPVHRAPEALRRGLARRGIFVAPGSMALHEARIASGSPLPTHEGDTGPAEDRYAFEAEGRWLAAAQPDGTSPLASLVSASFELLLAALPGETTDPLGLDLDSPSAADAQAATGVASLGVALPRDPKPDTDLRGRLVGESLGAGARATASITWFDGEGRPVVWIEGLAVSRVVAARDRPLDSTLFTQHWRRTAPLDPSQAETDSGRWLLVARQDATSGRHADQLRSLLDRRGLPSQIVGPEAPRVPQGVGTIVWLASLDLDPQGSGPDAAGEIAGWRGILELWRRLRNISNQADGSSETRENALTPRLVVVTRGQDRADGAPEDPPEGGGPNGPAEMLAGLLGVARAEAREHRPTWVELGFPRDVSESSWQPLLEALVDECLTTEDDTPRDAAPWRVRLDSTGRWTLERVPLAITSTEPPPRQDRLGTGTWVVSGGTGALGLAVARDLVAQGADSLLLLARRPPEVAIRQSLDALQSRGIRVRWAEVDVADGTAIDVALAQARRDGPPIVGIVHAAGSSADGPLETLDGERFREVLGAKADGAWNLHHATRDDPVAYFLLFGSVAAVLGWPGQGAYATANAGLGALARRRRAAGLPALAIAWPGWSGLGLAATEGGRAALDHLERQGLGSLTGVQGLTLTRRLLAADDLPPEVLILPHDAEIWSPHRDTDTSHQRPSEADAGKRTGLADELLAVPVGPLRRRAFEDRLRAEVAQVLGLAEGAIERDRPWADLGLGSLMALELRRRLETLTGRTLSTTVVWSHPCLRDLADHLAVRLALPLTAESVPPETSPDPVEEHRGGESGEGDDDEALLDWLDELAESEL